jgi:hypothetical protein
MASGKLTPGSNTAVHNMQGTIYEKVVSTPYTYHCHAPITDQALLANPVWTIWREHDDGNITCPTDGSRPTPDNNVASNPAGLPYWATA